jgi:hypothetical protein
MYGLVTLVAMERALNAAYAEGREPAVLLIHPDSVGHASEVLLFQGVAVLKSRDVPLGEVVVASWRGRSIAGRVCRRVEEGEVV